MSDDKNPRSPYSNQIDLGEDPSEKPTPLISNKGALLLSSSSDSSKNSFESDHTRSDSPSHEKVDVEIEKKKHKEVDVDKERFEVFTTCHATKALFIMSFGPALAQFATSLTGVFISLLVGKKFHEVGTTVLGNIHAFEHISHCFATYFAICVAAKLSFLFGSHHKDRTSQVYVDFIRFALLIGIILPAVLIPCSKALIAWYEGSAEFIDESFLYLIPTQIGSFFAILLHVNCGVLESMHFIGWYSFYVILSIVLSCGVFCPLFIFAFKWPLWTAALSVALGNAIPSIALTIMIFKEQFIIRPQFRMFFRKFDSYSFSALAIAFPTLLQYLATDIPIVVLIKYFSDAANSLGIYDEIMSVINTISKLTEITNSICFALSEALILLGSFAFGYNNFRRLEHIIIRCVMVMTAWTFLNAIIVIAIPKQIASQYDQNEIYLNFSEKMLRIFGYSQFFVSFISVSIQTMTVTDTKTFAILTTCLSLIIPIPLFSTILNHAKPHDPVFLTWCYLITNVFIILLCSIFLIYPIIKIRKGIKLQKDELIQQNGNKNIHHPLNNITDPHDLNVDNGHLEVKSEASKKEEDVKP